METAGVLPAGAAPGEPSFALRLADLVNGGWFSKVTDLYLSQRSGRPRADAAPGASGEALVERASLESALGGAATAAVSTAAAWLSAQGPLGALAALPVGAVAVAAEMILRALVDLRLVCDLADRTGLPFGEADRADVTRLCALSQGGSGPRDGLGRGLVERLLGTEDEEHARSAGGRRLGEGIAKNLVPALNVVTSAATSWVRTRQLGRAAWRFVRFRRVARALRADLASPEVRRLFVEAAWVLFTADGPLEPAEASLLVHALREVAPERRGEVTTRFEPDRAQFLERLRGAPRRARAVVWAALEQLAAADGEISAADRRVLEAAAEALGRGVDAGRLSELTRSLRTPAPRRARAPRHDGVGRRRRRPSPSHPEPAHP